MVGIIYTALFYIPCCFVSNQQNNQSSGVPTVSLFNPNIHNTNRKALICVATKTSLTPSLYKYSEHKIPMSPPVRYNVVSRLSMKDLMRVGEYSANKMKQNIACTDIVTRSDSKNQNSHALLTQKYRLVVSKPVSKPTTMAGFILPYFSMTTSIRRFDSGSDKVIKLISTSVLGSKEHELSTATTVPVQ